MSSVLDKVLLAKGQIAQIAGSHERSRLQLQLGVLQGPFVEYRLHANACLVQRAEGHLAPAFLEKS